MISKTKYDKEVLDTQDMLKSGVIYDSLGVQVDYTFGDFHRWQDIGLVFGFAWEKRIKAGGLIFELQYDQGLLNFNKLSEQRNNKQYG